MEQQTKEDNTPYFYLLVTDNYAMGTPRAIPESDRTVELQFNKLAESYDLQTKLKMASAVAIKPDVKYADPISGDELRQSVASYLSAFANDPAERQKRRDYLINNGLVRILFRNDELLQEVREAV